MHERPATRRRPGRWQVPAGLALAALVAVVANSAIASGFKALGASGAFPGLRFQAYTSLTVIGLLAGAAGWVLVRRLAKDPERTLRRLVPAVVALSLIPDVALLLTDTPNVSGLTVAALVLMHLVVACAAVLTFRRVLPVAGRRSGQPDTGDGVDRQTPAGT